MGLWVSLPSAKEVLFQSLATRRPDAIHQARGIIKATGEFPSAMVQLDGSGMSQAWGFDIWNLQSSIIYLADDM